MQVVLDIVVIAYLVMLFTDQAFHFLRIVGAVGWPLRELRGAVLIAQVGEGSVWLQPLLVLLIEGLEPLGFEYLRAFLLIHFPHIAAFQVVHSFVVDLWQGIHSLAFLLIFRHLSFVSQLTQLMQVEVHGMQREDADAVVGVGVGP